MSPKKCGMIFLLFLSGCSTMTTEEKLKHKAVVCVYTQHGKVCKEGKE